MGLKNYIVATIILLGLISGLVYSLNLGEYTLNINTQIEDIIIIQTLPIYIWIVAPAVLLFVFSVIHMSYYGSKNYFIRKAFVNDSHTINRYLEERILNEQSHKKLKTKEFKELGKILNQLEINACCNELESCDDSLKTTVKKVHDINENKYISIKSLKLDRENPLEVKNLINRIKTDMNFAYEVLKNSSKYEKNIVQIAFDLILDNKDLDRIKNLTDKLPLSNEMLSKLLLKDSVLKGDKRYTNAQILHLIQDNELSNKELIEIAKNYKKTMQPEQLIKLFEDIVASNENLMESYLYVLFQYEMLAQIKEILDNSQKDEYSIFKALIDLKEAGKHYSVESLSLS